MSYLKYWNDCIDRNILSGTVTAAGSCTIQLSLDREGGRGLSTEKGEQRTLNRIETD